MMSSNAVIRWANSLLGTDPHQRAYTAQALSTLGVHLGLSLVMWIAVAFGVVAVLPATLFTAVALLGAGLLFMLVRSGWHAHQKADPGLSITQTVFSIMAGNLAYMAGGAARGALLLPMLLGLTVGMFAMSTRQARQLCALATVMLAVTMTVCGFTSPEQFAPRQELLHFLIVLLVMPVTGWLAGQLSSVRGLLQQQKSQLDNAMAQNRLLTTLDELTGLSNRRHMTTLMVAERARQLRSRNPLCMVLMDIDHFKRINDRFGHHAGDQVLQVFSDVITHGLRTGDAVARWGGEEFLLMLPNTSAHDALVCVDRMRTQLAARSLDHIGPRLSVTFSAGIGVCEVGDRIEAIIERADQAMSRAKSDGRNRTVVA